MIYSSKRIPIAALLKEGCINKLVGDLPSKPRLAFVVQVRSIPKFPFEYFVNLSKAISDIALIIYADNYFSQLFCGRSNEQQAQIDLLYRDFFTKRDCQIVFSKDLLSTGYLSLNNIQNLISILTLKDFIDCLPFSKRENWRCLSVDEIFHMLMELLLFRYIEQKCDTLLIGHTSQAILFLYRKKVIRGRLSAIITPPFPNNEKVKKYLHKLSFVADNYKSY